MKIYFDMDGVLADFDRSIKELCHMEPKNINEGFSKERDDLMWEKIRGVDHFYHKLKPIKGSIELFNVLKDEHDCEILTGIPSPGRGITDASDDKIRWVKEHLGEDVKVNVVYRSEKTDYCNEDSILIDDFKKNIAEWESCGGKGVLFTTPVQALNDIKEILKEKEEDLGR